jgi:hypothetical protein
MSPQSGSCESKNVVLRIDNFVRLDPNCADYSGGLFLIFDNRNSRPTRVPFCWPVSSKAPGSFPMVVSPKRKNWCVSSYISYSWIDVQGREVLKGVSPLNCESLNLKGQSQGKRFVLFKIPDKPGRYRFKLAFDNTVIDRMGKNFAEYFPADHSTFRSDIESVVDVQ